MDWATRRKAMAITVLALTGAAALAILAIALFYRLPTCGDGKQNQDEGGVDCGGSCPRVCALDARPARVSFARALTQAGRTDAIVYVENPNREAYAPAATVVVELYGTDGLLAEARTVAYLPPATLVPVYFAGVASDALPVRQAFARVEEPAWMRAAPTDPLPEVSEVVTRDQATRPRVTATLTNLTARRAIRVPVVATVFDADGTAIAASRTIIADLSPQGRATATFTWNEPWPAPAARVEVMPLPEPPRPGTP